MSDELIEVELENGMLSFDGRVVEAFGIEQHHVLRVHVKLIESVELTEGRLAGGVLRMKARGPIVWGLNMKRLEGSRRPAVEEFITAVRAAAPNLRA